MAHLEDTRAFFGPRAAGWDQRFPDDDAVYREAVAAVGVEPGATVVDLGCGTGRALPLLREAVGPDGVVIGVDATPEMLDVATREGRERAGLLLGDVMHLPVGAARVDAFFAAGLLEHVPAPGALLEVLAAAAASRARLAVFHPLGRAALAARHGRTLRDDELLARRVLPGVLRSAGWKVERFDDGPRRYLVIASKA